MKKILIIFLGIIIFTGFSCTDFIETTSPSNSDDDFVFSDGDEAFKVLAGGYEMLRVNAGRFFYDIDVVGSDAECHPEGYASQVRHVPEGLYATEITINYATSVNAWNDYYKLINLTNIIISKIEPMDLFQSAKASGTPNKLSHVYGEAVTLQAYAYGELIRFFGDVPLITAYKTFNSGGLVSRDEIYDYQIKALMDVEPLMFRIGEGGITAERFNRTYVQGLIGRLALFAGGYGLRRTDFDYGDVSFTQIGIENWNAKYVRRTDYIKYYEIAKTYLEACESNSGSAYLITTDNRGAAYNNPFQRNFQYNMDLAISPESLYELSETQGSSGNSERPYAFGRPSDGGSANAYPCKSYGQSRMYASFYYGDYDSTDLRRDVSITVTANSGACVEKLISFAPGSRSSGGLANNKWDESRMAKPYTASQRKSGINWPIMRMPDVFLMLAEVYAELGDEAKAKIELTKVRSRAFTTADQQTKVTDYIGSLSGDALKEAILQERKLEFAGEGFRRYDLIRTGKLPEKIKQLRDRQIAMVDGLRTNGYYTFPNGNTITAYIYVKSLNVSSLGMSKMLTLQCNVAETDQTFPAKFPSWRGNCDLWTAAPNSFTASTGNRNLAIKGLFRYIDPNGTEAASLVTAGYVKTKWGQTIVENASQYTTDIFKGYPDNYYSSGIPPRYLFPLSAETVALSDSLITNGYGFGQ
jgi:hypothetical protein